MSECCSGEEEEEEYNYDNQYNLRKRKIAPIEWNSKNKIPPPPPRENPNARDENIMLSNGSVMIRHVKYCTKTHENYEVKIKTLGDLISLADYYNKQFDKKKTCNIELKTIALMAPHIYELNNMIGMEKIKDQVLGIALFYLQRLDTSNHDMLHTTIYGGPGRGKTVLIYILANIFATLGVTEGNRVTFVKRSDMIGQYLGQTATKTRKVIEEAMPGILVIDEAYSLGDTEQRDSYSRECLDTLNQFLSEQKHRLICIVAGYKEDIEKRFFKTNPGLRRRFSLHFEIEDYKPNQLREIFLQGIKRLGWQIDEKAAPLCFFEDNMEHFPNMGGDMELLIGKMKMEHGRRVFSMPLYMHRMITQEDVDAGMEKFLNNSINDKKDTKPPFMMYT
jgi:DNA replication protein DnaC